MTRGWAILVTVAASCLVTACAGGASDSASGPPSGPSTSAASVQTTSAAVPTTVEVVPATTLPPVATAPPTTAVTITPAPTAAPPTQPVASVAETVAPRTRCEASLDPPASSAGLQATFADVDADSRTDVVWIYDAADGTHLHLRTGRGATDDIRLAYGKGAVAVGAAQVDLAVGSPEPGTPQEIFAVTSDGDGRRLVGVYGFVIKTGCIEPFVFNQGAPFVYLVSRNDTLSGLRCVSDGVTGHLEALSAVPSGTGDFSTTRLVFGRTGRRLVPVASESGQIAGDPSALAAESDVTGCALSRPAF